MNQQIKAGLYPFLVILGPTGSGKSELGLALAEEFSGEIVNSDSVQVHRGLDIGSAKTPPEKRRGIPHRLLDVVGPDGELTAGAYAREARTVLADVRARGKLPIVVGGTGFYVRALLEGLSPAPERDPELRARLARLENRRTGVLYRFLRRHDPKAAGQIHPNDIQKLTRAVEMTVSARRAASEIQSEPRTELKGFSALKIGLAPRREDLRRHINERTERMFANGLLEETRALLAAGCPPEAKALQALGYRQALKVLSGHMSVTEAIIECQQKTRQYAKRQMTWFRRDPGIHWLGLSGFGMELSLKREAIVFTRQWLMSVYGYSLSNSEQLK
ncbi:MAG TPA: tRNA (adenosine(37)-N6)-dimethylallyltransferase MiaA [Bryobacteraceae bacterium]|nr:tRNA (adenosine(37)-N6)-dimethylallyltransferase MiaA [Bryobacteraceae bacterium]